MKRNIGYTLCALLFSFASAQSIYAADPLRIPGIIEVEDFDEGEDGVAYHDEDDVNEGGVYRTNVGVDIDTCAGGGYVIGWTHKGEWMSYTINVEKDGAYTFSALVASGLNGSAFSLSIDGEAITSKVEAPNTGDWTTYKAVSAKTSVLKAGKHTLKLSIESDYVNIDKIMFRPADEAVKTTFTSPSESSPMRAGSPFTVAWETNEFSSELYNLYWVNANGDTTLIKEDVTNTGSYTAVIPEQMLNESGHYTLSQTKTSGGGIPDNFDGKKHTVNNPLIWADVPDVSVIRVDDTYYMVSTTMHCNPGVPVMASKDLVRWRTINYCHQALVSNDNMNMNGGKNAYGKGSWASNIKYKNGTWYVLTPSYTSNRSHIYKTNDITSGKWETATLPFYHDPSLLLDDDGRIYVIYGSGNISIVELSSDAMSVKGSSRTLLQKPASICNSSGYYVECEGSQAMKIGDYYYVFLISWPSNNCRSVICYRSKSLNGQWEGKVLLQNNGVAQGGIFDTPDGQWWGMFFRDSGSVGRIPYLVNVTWQNGWPVLGTSGKVPASFQMDAAQEDGYGIVTSDEFDETELPLEWQWNHNPENNNWKLMDGKLRLTNNRTDADVVSTKNTLTQRSFGPNCSGWTKVNVQGMKDGDYAGLVALQEIYGFAGVRAANGGKQIVMNNKGKDVASIPLNQNEVYFRIDMNYQNQADKATFYYSLDGNNWTKFGDEIKMEYKLTHFMGYRYGLFHYSTRSAGGYADFDYFRIGKNTNSPIYVERGEKKTEEILLAESINVTIIEKSTVGLDDLSGEKVMVGPNPATQYVKVTGAEELISLELFDMNGTLVNVSNSDEMDLPVQSGNYLLRIRTAKGTVTEKIIVK